MTGAQLPVHDNNPQPKTRWQSLTAAEKQAEVRQLIAREGKTYGQAAVILGCSRVAVAGVVERSLRKAEPIVSTRPSGWNGLRHAVNGGQKTAKTKAANKARQKPLLPRILTPAVYPEGPPTDPTPLKSAAWIALPGSSPIALHEHVEGLCRWPTGPDLPFLYCGLPIKSGSSYCAGHSAIAFRELPKKETAR